MAGPGGPYGGAGGGSYGGGMTQGQIPTQVTLKSTTTTELKPAQTASK
jgi:hypothetical protein